MEERELGVHLVLSQFCSPPFCGGYAGWVGAQIETTPAAGGVPGSVEEMQEETLSRPVCDFPPLPEVET